MGYRSNVAYRIAFENKTYLNEFIALVMVKGGEEKKALSECQIELPDNGRGECYVNYYGEDLKWYESFADVQAHTWLYEYAVERFEEHAAYKFLRIGEDPKDIDEDEGGADLILEDLNDDMRINTTMDLPFLWSYEPIGDALSIVEVIPDAKT
jgi:hypothetical protein